MDVSTLTSDQVASKLEIIRDGIIGSKYITDSLLDRADKLENEIRTQQAQFQDLSRNTIRTDARIATIERYLDGMNSDIRTIRNSVVGAIVVAIVIGVASIALSTVSRTTHPQITAPNTHRNV